MMLEIRHVPSPTAVDASRAVVRARNALGWFFAICGGVHLLLAAVNPQTYRHFADGALLPFVETAWREIFMADPAGWALVLAELEALMGAALLMGGLWSRIGYIGVIGFHVALMAFGWGFWLWSVPALLVVAVIASKDDVWRPLQSTSSAPTSSE
jgi:hypothetical protein